LCGELCIQKILIDNSRAICGVSGQIFEISSIDFEVIRMFLCNEVLQKIASRIKSHEESKIEPHDELNDKSKVEFEVKKCANLEVESSKDFIFKQEDQGSLHQDNQDSIDNDYTLE
jgi:hypothetical protein